MMLSVLVWLAMWGQGQAQQPCGIQPNTLEIRDCSHDAPQSATDPGTPHVKPKPAEHVIEIKTVRRKKRTVVILPERYSADYLQGFKEGCEKFPQLHGKFINGVCEQTVAMPVIRELWIDGQKLGVIKGLE